MKRKLLPVFLLILVSIFFFYPILKGQIPFPGDLLVGNYSPYNTNSYDGYLPGTIVHKAQGIDVVRQLFPWKYFSIESFKKLEVPLWNPYNFSGNPHMANFQTGVFYPVNLVFFIASFINGWTLYILLIPILSAFFTYLFLRELDRSEEASIYGGLVFAFSSYMVVWLEWGNVGHTLLWLPLVLLCVEKYLKNAKIRYLILLVLALTFSFLAGYIQGYFYIVFIAFFYFLTRQSFSLRKKLLFFVALIYPLFLGAMQLFPTIEFFQMSARTNYSLFQIQNLLNPIWYLVTIAVPNFFGNPANRNNWFPTYIERTLYFGFLPLALSVLALFNLRKNKEILFFGAVGIIALVFSTDLFFNRFLYLLPIPVVSTTIPTRILSLFVFSGSILSAFGFDFILGEKKNKQAVKTMIGFFILLSFVWIFIFAAPKVFNPTDWVSNLSISKRNMVLPSVFLLVSSVIFFIRFPVKKITIVLIFALTIFDLFYFFHKITPFSPRNYIYPQTDVFNFLQTKGAINRFWGYGSGSIDTNFETYEKIYSTDGYDPLHSKQYGQLLTASKNGIAMENPPRSDANILGGYGVDDLSQNWYRQRVLNLLNVKYIVSKNADSSTFPKSLYLPIWQKGEWQIYENKDALSRVFFASSYVVKKNDEDAIETLFDKKTNIQDTVILSEDVKGLGIAKDSTATAIVESYTPNTIKIKTKAKTSMLLVLSDSFFPGWEVYIDGKNDKIYRADYALRAVVVKEGDHDIVFAYHPKSFTYGLLVSGLSLIGILLFTFLKISKKQI